jgi:hypothetical protein
MEWTRLEGAMLSQPERTPTPPQPAQNQQQQPQQQQSNGQARKQTFSPKAGATPNGAHRAKFQQRGQAKGLDR